MIGLFEKGLNWAAKNAEATNIRANSGELFNGREIAADIGHSIEIVSERLKGVRPKGDMDSRII